MKISILNPIGYCSGVKNAVFIAEKARKENPNKEIYVLGKLVHNEFIIEHLNALKIHTLYDKNVPQEKLLNDIPNESIVIFTAHGHKKDLDEIAKQKNLKIYDAVCPKVKFNMNNINKYVKDNHQIIFIGIKNHPETTACLSISNNVFLYDINEIFDYGQITDKTPYVTNQTTLNYLELDKIHNEILSHYPNAIIANEICKATRERQEKISNLDDDVDVVFIIGDKDSSNTNRLFEISSKKNKNATTYLISSKNDLTIEMLKNKKHLVVASGASAPDETIQSVLNTITELTK